ncbi:hypothetical protein CBS101457_000471 [Exobasidium rhododendri]|nr:hypothetical protein CBS101457_000471 [Exobasidium rhododendri]
MSSPAVDGIQSAPSPEFEAEKGHRGQTDVQSLEKQSTDDNDILNDKIALNKKNNGGLGPVALIFACGTALFSDGYINANSGPTNTILKRIYGQSGMGVPDDKLATTAQLTHFSSLYSSMTFAGTLLGMLVFGVLSDRIGRKFGMVFASLWLALFSVLIAGAWGAGGSTGGLFAALEAYRFIQGIGAGSVACSENTEGAGINPKRQQMYFVLATNTMIDLGFVAATLVALILYVIFGDKHLVWVWRLTLGLGAIPPLVILFFRVKMQETEHFKKGAIKKKLPWWLIIKKYWSKLGAVCIAWFIYDYISYPASIYSSYFVSEIVPDNDLFKSLGWSVLINAFYIPGTFAGAFVCDKIGPKNTMIIGLVLQAVFGFALAGAFGQLKGNLPGLVILYGFYVAFGEFGPGNNLGLLASKAVAPSAVRGTFYGVAAGIGKVGAFTGSYLYSTIQDDVVNKKLIAAGGLATDQNIYYSAPFYIGAALAAFAAVIVFFFVPPVVQDGMAKIDGEFEEYLRANGYDMSNVGLLDEKASDTEVGKDV